MRRTPALLTAVPAGVLLAVALSGCTSGGVDGCMPAFASGDASALVSASGSVGSKPATDFPTPLITEGGERTTIVAGDGAVVQPGWQVDFQLTAYVGETGEQFTATSYNADSHGRVAADDTDALHESFQCARVGERFALTATAEASFGEGRLAQYGIDDDDTLVFVVDVVDAYLGKANGLNQLPLDGMPTVVQAPDGQPGIIVPATEPPSELRVSAIKAGSGEELKAGERVVVHYTGWTWPATEGTKPTSYQSTWEKGQAATVELTSSDDGGVLPPGIVSALVGAKVGSQILAVVPPEQGYPEGKAPSGVDADSTLIVVIDVLGVPSGQ